MKRPYTKPEVKVLKPTPVADWHKPESKITACRLKNLPARFESRARA